ncbi:microcystin-dependent protein [Massilia sp. TW-1]|uniref:Microcystin-dependent protein n=1 Tax=Telluria antibiotica TaxID=2717319 RepID=A0ABX0P8F8_9BURK|nr:tail fiber protein [Telluria antibiotica]NIA53506.1 microcystin-dependent protein [Telluria antibiotica]
MKRRPQTKLSLCMVLAGLGLSAWSPVSQACSSDPYLASVCVMAISPTRFPSFSNTYVLAMGQTMQVNQNAALYSLLGTTYGGNGQSTFNLPDLRGRVIVGYNPVNLPNVPAMANATAGGNTTIKLTVAQLPASGVQMTNVPVTLGGVTATTSLTGLTATANLGGLVLNGPASGLTVKVAQSANGLATPSGNYLGKSNGGAANIYTSSAPDATLNTGTIGGTLSFTVNQNTTAPVTLAGSPTTTLSGQATISGTTGPLGSGGDVPIMQPYLVMPYYIAVQGMYPASE